MRPYFVDAKRRLITGLPLCQVLEMRTDPKESAGNGLTPVFKALIFDLDGTLVDSWAVVYKVMETWCNKHGLSLQAALDACRGTRTEDTVAQVAPHLCAKEEAAAIDRMEDESLADLEPIAGADRFLRELVAHGGAWAIVTSSAEMTAKLKLQTCHLPTPPVLITAESVEHGKPHPAPFLAAVKQLGVEPGACLVFEDADSGVQSALTAGCQVVVVGDACGVDDPKIIARIASFEAVRFGEGGGLQIGIVAVSLAGHSATNR